LIKVPDDNLGSGTAWIVEIVTTFECLKLFTKAILPHYVIQLGNSGGLRMIARLKIAVVALSLVLAACVEINTKEYRFEGVTKTTSRRLFPDKVEQVNLRFAPTSSERGVYEVFENGDKLIGYAVVHYDRPSTESQNSIYPVSPVRGVRGELVQTIIARAFQQEPLPSSLTINWVEDKESAELMTTVYIPQVVGFDLNYPGGISYSFRSN
jgi:hypothetical protein